MPGAGPKQRPVVAGNEVGIIGARKCALPLSSAHLCARFICGNMETTWWRECGCIPGGQGVAGSNPAVPTRRSRSEVVLGSGPGPFSIFRSQSGSHRRAMCSWWVVGYARLRGRGLAGVARRVAGLCR